MICLETVKQYCKEYWKIENYDQAVADESQTWLCHHRNEIDMKMSSTELKRLGLYYNRPADEFIFLTRSNHSTLHNHNNSYINISYNELYDLRIVKLKTYEEIAKHYNIAESTVVKKLLEYNIKLPNKGITKKGNKSYQYKEIPFNILYRLRVKDGLTINEIARLLNVNKETIRTRLKNYKITKNG